MKTLVLEDLRGTVLSGRGEKFRVLEMVNTIEWEIGEHISKEQVCNILNRVGHSAVHVKIKKKR